MTDIHQLAIEKIEAFRAALAKYKSDSGATYEELADLCDVAHTIIGDFIRAKCRPTGTSLVKISLGTGIPF